MDYINDIDKNTTTDILKIYNGAEAYRIYNKLFNNQNNRMTSSQIDDSILLLYKYNDNDTVDEIRCKFIVTDSYKTRVLEKEYNNTQYKTIIEIIS